MGIAMRLIAALAVAIAIIIGAVAPGQAEKRVALVIGNGAYQHLPRLANPPNDARDLAAALKAMDFEVDLGMNLSLSDMQRMVTEFARKARGADVALAFFGGHGVQAPDPYGAPQPVNYLLPVDADIKDAADLGFQLAARDIVARLQGADGIRILILDACRNNPLPQRLAGGRSAAARGLGPEPRASGTLIAFSTQPNETADDGVGHNSPFMAALLRRLPEPGLDVRLLFADVRGDVMRATKNAQKPETWDLLDGRFAFKPATAAAVPAATQPAPSAATLARPSSPAPLPPVAAVAPPVAPAVPPADPCAGAVTAAFPSRCAAPLTAAQERGLKPKDSFKECENCPEMVVVPAGSFTMGSPASEAERYSDEGPQHRITFGRSFAVGRFAVTFEEWDACVADSGCKGYKPGNAGWGRGRLPVIDVSWDDASAYVAWLSGRPARATGC